MDTVKVGDKVRCLVDEMDVRKDAIYTVTDVDEKRGTVYFIDDVMEDYCLSVGQFEVVGSTAHTPSLSTLSSQVGGDHYRRMKIQPMEYILANNLGFNEGSIVKYVSRWQFKNGVEDLKKARQNLDVLIEYAEKEAAKSA